MLTSYENCWALRHKIQDLIENGTTAGLLDIRSMSDGKWNHRSIPSIFSNHWHQSITLLCSWTLLSCGEEFPVDLSQLINLPGTLVQVLLVKRSTPLFTPINYSPSDPFIIYVFAHASPHSLAQNMAWLTISHDPHPVVKPVLIIGGSEAKQASKIGGVARIGPVYQPKDLADAEERK